MKEKAKKIGYVKAPTQQEARSLRRHPVVPPLSKPILNLSEIVKVLEALFYPAPTVSLRTNLSMADLCGRLALTDMKKVQQLVDAAFVAAREHWMSPPPSDIKDIARRKLILLVSNLRYDTGNRPFEDFLGSLKALKQPGSILL